MNENGINVLSLFDGMACTRMALEVLGVKVNKYFASEVDKYSIQMSKHLYPDIVHLGDVQFITANTFGSHRIDLIVGGSPCFTEDATVLTDRGRVSIKDVCVDDMVITHTGEWRKVLRTGGKCSDTVLLRAMGVLDTETTEEHPYYVKSVNRVWDNVSRRWMRFLDSDARWEDVGNLKVGDYIGVPIIKDSENELELTIEECFVLGRYIADGHTRKDHRRSEGRLGDRHWQLILSIGKGKTFKTTLPHSLYPHTKSTSRMVFSSKRLVQIAEEYCGCGAANKMIHPLLLKLPKEHLASLIDGILSGDGSFRKGTYRVTTISRGLAMDISLAVAKVYGTGCSIEFTKRPPTCVIEGRTVNQNDSYTVSFSKFRKVGVRWFNEGGHIWYPVKSVERTGNAKMVYNLEVDVDNSYTANNAVVHNCQGFSNAGRGLNFDDPRSALFFEYVRLVRELRPRYFLLENVKMKGEWRDIISKYMGVEPIFVNSALLSAQNRQRYYWTNIKGVEQPEDRGIVLRDILESGTVIDESGETILGNVNPSGRGMNGLVRSTGCDKSNAITTNKGEGPKYGHVDPSKPNQVNPSKDAGGKQPHMQDRVFDENGKSHALTAGFASSTNVQTSVLEQHGDKLRVPEATKKGYAEAGEGEGLDLSFPKSKTRRGRLMKDKSNCVTSAGQDMGVVVKMDPTKSNIIGRINSSQDGVVVDSGGKSPCHTSGHGNVPKVGEIRPASIVGRRINENGKRDDYNTDLKKVQYLEVNEDSSKTRCLTTVDKDNVVTTEMPGKHADVYNRPELKWRKLTVRECARLQTVPEHIIDRMMESGVSNSQMYKQLGNGFTVDVIAHILSFAKWQS